MNETPASPIGQQSIETPVFTPNQTQWEQRQRMSRHPSLIKQNKILTMSDPIPRRIEHGLRQLFVKFHWRGSLAARLRRIISGNRTRVEESVCQVSLEGKFSH
ncbi:hypothetical protein YC2023_011719 [Brassica napus]